MFCLNGAKLNIGLVHVLYIIRCLPPPPPHAPLPSPGHINKKG